MDKDLEKKVFHNLCWTVYLHPYTFVVPDNEEPWEVNLKDINNISYNNGNLVKIVSSFKIPNCETVGFICYDGAISIPRLKPFMSIENAEIFFNTFLAKLLLKDFYVEGIDVRDIVNAQLLENWAIWNSGFGSSLNSQLHTKVRMKLTSNMETIHLANPRILRVSEINSMLVEGEKVFNKIPNLTPKFLTNGITEIHYKNWDLALSNLWITAEQIIDHLWHTKFIADINYHPTKNISGRKDSFKEDNRTWSTSVKQEMLYQSKIINADIFESLFDARKARNKLVHEGKSVNESVAIRLFGSIKGLIELATNESNLLNTVAIDEKKQLDKATQIDIDFFSDWIETGKKFI